MKVDRDKVLKESIEQIVKNLLEVIPKKLEKEELCYASLGEGGGKRILITDNVGHLSLDEFDVVFLFIDDKLDDDIMRNIVKHEVWGIFVKKNFLSEYEEKGKFEASLKEAIRAIAMESIHDESLFYKRVDWKYGFKPSTKKSSVEENNFISLFLDPSMRQVASQIRYVCNQVKESYGKLNLSKKLNDRLELIKKLKSSERSEGESEKRKNSMDEMIRNKFGAPFAGKGLIPSVLIEGETGTGKTLVAELIAKAAYEAVQNGGVRFEDFFCRFSMVNMASDIVDSELFGTRAGAYTDATDRLGKILAFAGGVVFLDEIGEIDAHLQAKLLLYLDRWLVQPAGSDEVFYAPTIIVAATNRDLRRMIEEGKFRADLYHRFRYKIHLPPLRERKKDLRLLISFCLSISEARERGVEKISLRALEKLESYHYPGNFRELMQIIEKAVHEASSRKRDIILERDIQF
ncbi:sigma-54-dependent transcriptional regulator [Thermotoga caldifontis]|uniref:sigma-54-dependent transcriptional regulator n=1 Tax=Thermotoga caldifontis TaxID=1508419 RepID=UPI000AB649AD|nr:sigma 54-interacting transcriptional regulator [Thermotoga caldifontis]